MYEQEMEIYAGILERGVDDGEWSAEDLAEAQKLHARFLVSGTSMQTDIDAVHRLPKNDRRRYYINVIVKHTFKNLVEGL